MDDLVSMFLIAQRAFNDRVHAVRDDQWHRPTPDTEWDIAALVDHIVDENRWLPPLVRGHNFDAAAKIVEGTRSLPADGGVGANLAQAWDDASLASAEAVQEDGALDRSADLSRGPTPVRDYLGEMMFDHLVHSWDLGAAIGFDGEPLPPELVEIAYALVGGMTEELAASGLFADPVDVPDGAPTLPKLIGLTGRDPNWAPG